MRQHHLSLLVLWCLKPRSDLPNFKNEVVKNRHTGMGLVNRKDRANGVDILLLLLS